MIRNLASTEFLAGLWVLLAWAAPAAGNSPPQVSNINAVQFQDNSGKVSVSFDLNDPDGNLVEVNLYLCRVGQPDPIMHCQNTDPLPGSLFNPGAGLIVIWDAGIDYPGHAGGDYFIRVVASDDHASGCQDYGDALHWVGRADVGFEGNDVCLSGNLALVSSLDHGLEIFDISNQNAPQLVGDYPTMYGAVSVEASPGYAFLGTPDAGILVLDLSTPASPSLVHTITEYPWAEFMLVEDGLLFTRAQGGAGFAIIDISTPSNPTQLSTSNTLGCSVLDVRGDLAYVAISTTRGGPGYLEVVDISNPNFPQARGACVTDGFYSDIAVTASGSHAMLLLDGWPNSLINIVDVQDPDNPVYVDQYDLYLDSTELEIAGSRMIVLDSECSGLYSFSLAVPTAPLQEGAVFKYCGGFGFGIEAGVAAIIDYSGLGLLHVGSGRVAGYLAGFIYGNCFDVVVDSGIAYVANLGYSPSHMYGMYTVDISDPEHPIYLGEITSMAGVSGLVVQGARAYLAAQAGFVIVDVSLPETPSTVATYATATNAYDVVVVGERAYVACGSYLEILDISNESEPVLLGSTYDGRGNRIAHYGDHVYVGRRGAGPVRIVNVADPAAPYHVGLVDVASSEDVLIRGSLLYTIERIDEYTSRLLVVDVLTGASPVILGSCLVPGRASGLARDGDVLYVTSEYFGVFIYDVSDPGNPVVVGAYNPTNVPSLYSNHFKAIALSETAVCFVDNDGIFYLAGQHCPGRVDQHHTPGPPVQLDLERW